MKDLLASPLLPVLLFVILFGSTFFGLSFFTPATNSSAAEKISITPVVSFAEDLRNCLDQDDTFNVTIDSPTTDQEFTADAIIPLQATVLNDCEQFLARRTAELNSTWSLQGQGEIAQGTESSIDGLNPGEYTVTFSSSMRIAGFGSKNATDEVTFTVREADVEGATTEPTATYLPTSTPTFTPTPTPTATQIPNQSPSASITTPANNSQFDAWAYDQNENPYATIDFSGIGSDPEDGTLQYNSLKWYHQREGTSNRVQFGSGTTAESDFITNYSGTGVKYRIFLVATDSNGAQAESVITIKVVQGYLY